MNVFTKQDLDLLIKQETAEQCVSVSIFMPTFRPGTEAQQGPSRLKNLLRKAEEGLAKNGIRPVTGGKILAPVRNLVNDSFFWQDQSDGLAIYTSPGLFKYYRVPVQLKELVVTAKHFVIKPLFPLITENGRFYVLAVSRKDIKLLQCTKFGYHELPLSGKVPTSLAEVMKYEDLDRKAQFQEYTEDTEHQGHTGTDAIATTLISHGKKVQQENKHRVLSYFKDVDRGIQEVLRYENSPLLFWGVDHLFPIYKQANSYANLIDMFIPGNPDKTASQVIHKSAWEIISPVYERNKLAAAAKYRRLAGTGFTSIDPTVIINSSFHGKVDTLIIDEKHELWGKLDNELMTVTVHEKPEPRDDDLITTAVINTITSRGSVYTAEKEKFPDITPIAAIMRQ